MTGTALIRPTSAKAWDLRSSWAAGWRVSVTTDLHDRQRIEGIVTRVAATDAYARVAGLVIPLERVLAVHKPSRLGDSKAGKVWAGKARLTPPQSEQLFGPAEREGS
ncbi:MAG: hypothetical protein JWM85_333 [Acidimicrobiaceae bacterium]|nr:hypothetical protein [Acidimicrobiaceae bacterium]